jgi:hypothetical protein
MESPSAGLVWPPLESFHVPNSIVFHSGEARHSSRPNLKVEGFHTIKFCADLGSRSPSASMEMTRSPWVESSPSASESPVALATESSLTLFRVQVSCRVMGNSLTEVEVEGPVAMGNGLWSRHKAPLGE